MTYATMYTLHTDVKDLAIYNSGVYDGEKLNTINNIDYKKIILYLMVHMESW